MSLSPPKPARYQSLDLWRGIICMFVVLEHAFVALWQDSDESWIRRLMVAPWQTNVGTPLFFVISGYCIASTLESCIRRKTHPLLFVARRFWRIFPPYWAAMLVFATMVVALDRAGLPQVHKNPFALEISSLEELNAHQWFGNVTLTETWRSRITPTETQVFTRVAWSLCYQEQFYVVCFLALLFGGKNLFRTLGIATIGIVAFRAVCGDSGRLHRIDGTFPVLWHQFALGLAAYYLLNKAPGPRLKSAILAGIVLIGAWGYWEREAGTVVASVFALLMIGLHRWDECWSKIQCVNPLRALGKRSYSIYLAHLPVLILVAGGLAELGVTSFWSRALITVPISTIAAVAGGLLFYRLVDSRFLDVPSFVKNPRPTAAVANPPEFVAAGVRTAAAAA